MMFAASAAVSAEEPPASTQPPSSLDTDAAPSDAAPSDAAPSDAASSASEESAHNGRSAEQIILEARKIAGLSSQSAALSGAHSFLSGVANKAGEVVVGALHMIGVRYRWGGSTPDSGLDCSGFVRYVFQDTLGMKLPRRAEEMSRVGQKVAVRDLKPGDLVFFNTMRRTFSHVGIYIGNNQFVHSPSTGSTIRVDELDTGYWEKRFTGARRINIVYRPAEQPQMGKATMQELN